jgi:hypothetical protein
MSEEEFDALVSRRVEQLRKDAAQDGEPFPDNAFQVLKDTYRGKEHELKAWLEAHP